jgi:hypothetical protein
MHFIVAASVMAIYSLTLEQNLIGTARGCEVRRERSFIVERCAARLPDPFNNLATGLHRVVCS